MYIIHGCNNENTKNENIARERQYTAQIKTHHVKERFSLQRGCKFRVENKLLVRCLFLRGNNPGYLKAAPSHQILYVFFSIVSDYRVQREWKKSPAEG